MSWKKVYKYMKALLHDNRSCLLSKKYFTSLENHRKQEPRKFQKVSETLSMWFLRKEYVETDWIKRLLLRIEFILRDTHGEKYMPHIPYRIRMEIARCLLPDIIAFYESETGQKEFVEWKIQQESGEKETGKVK